MAVTLLTSNSAKAAPVRPAAVPPFGATAPDIKLPLAFMLTGLAALTVGAAWLVAQPSVLATYHYNQSVIALTHLFVLGWICSIVMGAMYQLVPVALETKLYSESLARWQYAFHLAGFLGMVWMFRSWNMKQVGHFATIMTVGVGLFLYNIARTLARVPKWNVTATAVTAALGWISLTVLAGLSIAAAKCLGDFNEASPAGGVIGQLIGGLKAVGGVVSHFDAISAMHAHAHLGGVGFFMLLIVGISYKLIPMFTLSEIQSPLRAGVSVALLNVGLAGSFITILLRSPWKLAFSLTVFAALLVYAWELTAILKARKRRALDWGIRYFLTAVGLLMLVSLQALVLSWPGLPLNAFTGQLENLYGFLGLIGVITFVVIGMLYKIIPFLIWFGVYSKHIGRARVPALADMYSPRLQAVGYGSFLVALFVISAGILRANETAVRIGSVAFALSIATLLINAGHILAHAIRPRIQPMAAAPHAKAHSL